MIRSLLQICFLLGLFMFQSTWNIAAAFCDHSSNTISLTQQTHFGHHVTSERCQVSHDVFAHGELEKNQQKYVLNLQDHHDHLPIIQHILIIDTQAVLVLPQHFQLYHQAPYFWSNLYQSPYLGQFVPPPPLTPLLVG